MCVGSEVVVAVQYARRDRTIAKYFGRAPALTMKVQMIVDVGRFGLVRGEVIEKKGSELDCFTEW